jgi:hypothetical protein
MKLCLFTGERDRLLCPTAGGETLGYNVVEFEQRSKDEQYLNLFMQEKKVLIDGLRRENEVLMVLESLVAL